MAIIKKYRIPIVFTLIYMAIFILMQAGLLKQVDDVIDLKSRTITNTTVHKFFIIITNLGSGKVIGAICILTLFYTYNKLNNFRVLSILFFSSVGCYLLNSIIKNLIQRPRPPLPHLVVEHTPSFPSGHAMISMCFYLTLALILNKMNFKNIKAIKIALILLAILIAVSRVILHVHYFSDIIAGLTLGYSLYKLLKLKYCF
ncbi:phosphatase PAP2 family protein [Clostridium sp. 'deep sea']|uniref:phosphatase PAP2 family protein n=1 Tax=Clostridium sp. 'deep sea' TaxID=2779445 RepID=UPI0018968EEF|nr:phosphatase PAP2 family protein [Clostridium sp. 'deep sea']QOR36559.1 phosphatase PAP2 family protein [Clostridium sp. 'deep sea']